MKPGLCKSLKRWSGRRGSNPRRPAWEAGILPLNYSRSASILNVAKMALAFQPSGLELVFHRRCSICSAAQVLSRLVPERQRKLSTSTSTRREAMRQVVPSFFITNRTGIRRARIVEP